MNTTIAPSRTRLNRICSGLMMTLVLSGFIFGSLGCVATGTSLTEPNATADPTAPQARVADDFPVPSGSKVNTEETLVLGSGNNWTGRLSLVLSVDTQAAYVHFRDQAKAFGWNLVSGSFGTTSILTFAKGQRSATVLILDRSGLQSAKATITVSPMATPATK
jgi:hypothetical protein